MAKMAELPRLGPRLRAIASRVLAGRVLADLCCDHAQLAATLVAEGTVPRAIAGDVAAAPLAAAAELLAAAGLDGVELRQGDGLEVLGPHEAVGTIVLAGIGAPLAATLLERGRGRLAGCGRVIVQPNHGFPKLGSLRATLGGLGLRIIDESLSRERGRLYVTIVATPDSPPLVLDARARELGPILSRGHDPLWPAWREHEHQRVSRALAGLERGLARTPSEEATRASYRAYLAALASV